MNMTLQTSQKNLTLQDKREAIVALYNQVSGRGIKVLPREKRIEDAIRAFEPEDFYRTFLWAKHNNWCKKNNILMERIGWLCSYNCVAEHCDFKPPKGEHQWTIRSSTKR